VEFKIIRSFPIEKLEEFNFISSQYKIRTYACKPCRFFFTEKNRDQFGSNKLTVEDYAFLLDAILNSPLNTKSLKDILTLYTAVQDSAHLYGDKNLTLFFTHKILNYLDFHGLSLDSFVLKTEADRRNHLYLQECYEKKKKNDLSRDCTTCN